MKKFTILAAVFCAMFATASFAGMDGKAFKKDMTPEQKAEMHEMKMKKCMEMGKSEEVCKEKMANFKKDGKKMTAEEKADWVAKKEKMANMTDEEKAEFKAKMDDKKDKANKKGKEGQAKAKDKAREGKDIADKKAMKHKEGATDKKSELKKALDETEEEVTETYDEVRDEFSEPKPATEEKKPGFLNKLKFW